MIIRENNTNKVSNNFTEKEYFDASYGTGSISQFDYSNSVIQAAQIIRDHYGVPMKVTASYRTPEHDRSKGRSGTGQHTKKTAGDFAFLDGGNTLLMYHQDILNKGSLYQKLRNAGINAFGLYDNFLHIDSRSSGNQPDSNYGSYAFWDNRITTKKKLPA
jgi:hypothetical protein